MYRLSKGECDKSLTDCITKTYKTNDNTLGEGILACRKFGGNKIWRNWRDFNLADGGKHLFWRELNLADKHKIEYDKSFFFSKNDIFANQDKTKRKT